MLENNCSTAVLREPKKYFPLHHHGEVSLRTWPLSGGRLPRARRPARKRGAAGEAKKRQAAKRCSAEEPETPGPKKNITT